MNKINKQRIEADYLRYKIEKYPSFIGREHCIPPYKSKESGANDLTRLVIDFLTYNNCQAERISSQGQYRDGKKTITDVIGRQRTIGTGIWTPATSTKGTADISATIKGRSVKIEIKWGADRQSDAQKEYQLSIEKALGIYIIVKTFDKFN
jgi:hypothetical protein